jgi:hypothetical protein
MVEKNLKGWNYIVYMLIKNNFIYKSFNLNELYSFEQYFCLVYPANFHVKDKLRQILQNLRDKGLLEFLDKGRYALIQPESYDQLTTESHHELVYLLSNDSIPGWVKIGRTNAIERRLHELYNTSVPLPFKVEETISTTTLEQSSILEKSIHSVIDTLNPSLRKHTEAKKREFFKMTPDEGKSIFHLVTHIIGITPNQDRNISA